MGSSNSCVLTVLRLWMRTGRGELLVDHVDFRNVRVTVVASLSSETQVTFIQASCSAHMMMCSVDAETEATGQIFSSERSLKF